MPKFKPRRALRKGKRRRGPEAKRRRWLIRCLVNASGGKCCYCDKQCTRDEMTVDHIVPLSRGGLDEVTNLRLACFGCNQEKGNGTALDVFIEGEEA